MFNIFKLFAKKEKTFTNVYRMSTYDIAAITDTPHPRITFLASMKCSGELMREETGYKLTYSQVFSLSNEFTRKQSAAIMDSFEELSE